MKTWCTFCLLLIPLIARSANLSGAPVYSVQGRFTYQVYALQKEGEPIAQKPLHREFEVLVDDCSWRVKIVLSGNTDFDCFIYSYDGTNFISYGVRSDGKASGGLIDASPVPITVTSAAGEYPWLALASGCYLKGGNTRTMWSFERLRSRNGLRMRYAIPCRTVLSPTPPNLPTAIEWTTDHRAIFLQEDGDLTRVPLPASFGTNGYVAAELKSRGFTNVNGLSFPTGFELRKFRPMPNAKTTNDLRCTVFVSAVVTNITTGTARWDSRIPEMMVEDMRVPGPVLIYPIRNGFVPATNSAFVEDARKRAIKQRLGPGSGRRFGSLNRPRPVRT